VVDAHDPSKFVVVFGGWGGKRPLNTPSSTPSISAGRPPMPHFVLPKFHVLHACMHTRIPKRTHTRTHTHTHRPTGRLLQHLGLHPHRHDRGRVQAQPRRGGGGGRGAEGCAAARAAAGGSSLQVCVCVAAGCTVVSCADTSNLAANSRQGVQHRSPEPPIILDSMVPGRHHHRPCPHPTSHHDAASCCPSPTLQPVQLRHDDCAVCWVGHARVHPAAQHWRVCTHP